MRSAIKSSLRWSENIFYKTKKSYMAMMGSEEVKFYLFSMLKHFVYEWIINLLITHRLVW